MTRKKAEVRRVNIHPDNISIHTSKWLDKGFILTFIVYTDEQETQYRIHMDMFWLGILAKKLHDVIKAALMSCSDALQSMKG